MMAVIFSLIVDIRYGAAEEYPEWEGFPPMYEIKNIVEFQGYIFCTTNGGLLRYDPVTQEYTFFYKDHGLIKNDILSIGVTSKELFIGFQEDGLWRFDTDTGSGEQILFPEYHIKTPSTPNGIAVMNIYALNDTILFVGHARGLDVLNLHTEELRTYVNLGKRIAEGTPVNDVNIFGGKIWVCTHLGLAVADEDNPNLEFAENWKNYTYENVGITSIIHIVDAYEEGIYLGTNKEGILFFDEKIDKLRQSVSPKANVYTFSEGLGGYWASSNLGLFKKFGYRRWVLQDMSITNLTGLRAEGKDKLWIGTLRKSLKCFTKEGYVDISPPSHMSNKTFYDLDMTEDNILWCATSLKDASPFSTFQRLQEETWSIYDSDMGDWTSRVVSTLVDKHGLVWVGLWGSGKSGLYIIKDDGTPALGSDTVEAVDLEKHILKPTIWSKYVVCADIAEDKHGNIWVANLQVDPPEHAIESIPTSGAVVLDGYPITRYQHYSPAEDGLSSATITKICTDEDGWVWLATPHQERGLIVLFVGDDPYDKSDTEVYELTVDDGLNSMRINAIARDRDGYIWVGTNAGLNRISKENGHMLVVEDMNEAYGDNNRDISAIVVDRFNNKWIGTAGGLVKLNDKNKLEAVYTEQNSGLFSDAILSLKYYDKDDFLWVATAIGLNKFSVFGEEVTETLKDIHVYPNPFEIWGYDFRAVFTNLKPGSEIRIYTFTGTLVNELAVEENDESIVSTVVWDGRNFEGKYVGSGVYFFIGVDSKGRDFKDKMLVMRR